MLHLGAGRGGPDLFGELAQKFGVFVDVVAEVADATIAMGTESSKGLLKVYERWLKTGSERLASALTSRGVMPTRGTQGRPSVRRRSAGSQGERRRARARAGPRREVQAALERVYRLDRVADVGDFVQGAGEGEREALLCARPTTARSR